MPTIHDNRNRDPDLNGRPQRGIAPYILGGLAALAVIFGLTFVLSDRNATVATNERPAAATTTTPATTTPAVRETTGSGATMNRATDPTGSRPAVPGQVPAPASTNR